MLSVKENQPTLYNDCVDLFAWLRSPQPLDQPVTLGYDEQVDGDHGRIEADGPPAPARWSKR